MARLGRVSLDFGRMGATRLAERGKHLLDTGVWSDCSSSWVSHPSKIFHCHKAPPGLASPVFEAMFYGGRRDVKRDKDT